MLLPLPRFERIPDHRPDEIGDGSVLGEGGGTQLIKRGVVQPYVNGVQSFGVLRSLHNHEAYLRCLNAAILTLQRIADNCGCW